MALPELALEILLGVVVRRLVEAFGRRRSFLRNFVAFFERNSRSECRGVLRWKTLLSYPDGGAQSWCATRRSTLMQRLDDSSSTRRRGVGYAGWGRCTGVIVCCLDKLVVERLVWPFSTIMVDVLASDLPQVAHRAA